MNVDGSKVLKPFFFSTLPLQIIKKAVLEGKISVKKYFLATERDEN
jgi:hypothetical protein